MNAKLNSFRNIAAIKSALQSATPAPMKRASSARPYRAAGSECEEQLVELWEQLLGAKGIGVDEDFFALGGHSLLATQLIARVRQRYGVNLPLRTIFEGATIASLATLIEAQPIPGSTTGIPVADNSQAPSLSFAQQGMWALEQMEGGTSVNLVAGALRLRGALDESRLERALRQVEERHACLRTCISTLDGLPRPLIASAARLRIQQVNASSWRARDRDDFLAAELGKPIDLSTGLSWRATLIQCAQDDHLFSLALHHTICDRWSIGILMRDVAACYAGQVASLPTLPLQYTDFAAWQNAQLAAGAFKRHLKFWLTHLRDAPTQLGLPADRPRPASRSFAGASLAFTLGDQLSTALRGLALKHQASLFMLLFSAFNVLLARLTGMNDLIVGTYVAQRPSAELEGLIGPFINLLPLRTRVDNAASFATLLDQVRQTVLAAHANQEMPFEYLAQQLGLPHDLSHPPLCQVAFVMQNAAFELPKLPGIVVTQVDIPHTAAEFDLSMEMFERDGELTGNLVFNTALFTRETVQAFLRQWTEILHAIAADTGKPLSQLMKPSSAFTLRSSTAARLFCLPGAGANASAFDDFSLAWGPGTTVEVLEAKRLDSCAAADVSVAEIARAHIATMRAIQEKGPYHLAGHSFGGWCAFEMARKLLADGQQVGALILLDSAAPGANGVGGTRGDPLASLLQLVKVIEQANTLCLELDAGHLLPLNPRARQDLLRKRMEQAGLVSPHTPEHLFDRMVETFLRQVQIDYLPSTPFPQPMLYLRAADRDGEQSVTSASPAMEWRHHAPFLDEFEVPGNHMSMLKAPHVAAVVKRIRECWPALDQAHFG